MASISKPNDLAELEAGLGQAEDPYMIKDLLALSEGELVEKANRAIRYSAIAMIRAGQVFMALKAKVKADDRKWKAYVIEERRWSYHYVVLAMKMVEVAARIPKVIHLPPGRTTQRLLSMPMAQIEMVLDELPADAKETFTPWEIEKAKRKLPPKTKPRSKKPLPDIGPQDPEWNRLAHLFIETKLALDEVTNMLGELAKFRIKPEWYDVLFEKTWGHQIGSKTDAIMAAVDAIMLNFHPINEVRRRGIAWQEAQRKSKTFSRIR